MSVSTEPLALVQRYYDSFNARDWAGMLATVADDVVHDVNQGEREIGKAAFAAFVARMEHAYRERLVDLVLFAGPGGRVAAEFMVEGEYLAADPGMPPARGQRYRLPAGAFLDTGGGHITRVTTYYNLQGWLRQVG